MSEEIISAKDVNTSLSRYSKNGCFIYDAVKIALTFVDDNVIMNLLPTVYVLKKWISVR